MDLHNVINPTDEASEAGRKRKLEEMEKEMDRELDLALGFLDSDSDREEGDEEQKSEEPSAQHVDAESMGLPLGPFQPLPVELCFRVFSFLSAEDLATACSTCRAFNSLASCDNLWRRLYQARWGTPGAMDATRLQSSSSYKALYMERDLLDAVEIRSTVAPLLQPYYLQMTVSKRSLTLGRKHSDDMMIVNSEVSKRVYAWRSEHGFGNSSGGAAHSCKGRCAFQRIMENVFVCEASGWAHICDEGCREKVVDSASGLMVCPISGRSFDRLMTEREEEAEKDGKGQEDGAEEVTVGGRLGQAYLDGYNCNNEEELQRVCGVRLR